jgi:hypothetical protein
MPSETPLAQAIDFAYSEGCHCAAKIAAHIKYSAEWDVEKSVDEEPAERAPLPNGGDAVRGPGQII